MQARWKMAAIALAAFAVVALMDVAHYGYWLYINGKRVSIGFAMLHEAPPWILWGLCVPAVLRLGERFPLEWPPRARAVLVHLGGFAVATLILSLTGDLLELWLDVPPPTKPFWRLMRDTLVFRSSVALITYGATLGIGFAASYSARSRQLLELQSELQKTQLSALRMQLNPHFLFNTLHTIGALVRDGNHRGAVEMIEKLGDILRHVLRSDAEPETPLRDEIEFLRKYLEIEQVRFGDRLRVTWQLDASSEAVPVPQLILQPLVENALRHGLASRARPGALTISARVENDELQLTVSDDGVGLPGDVPARGGVGLANVRARLSRRYGEAASFSIAAGEPCGVTARIVLPLRTTTTRAEAHE